MIITQEYLKSIKPKNEHVSDKYSSRIYKYLKKHKNKDMLVFCDFPNDIPIDYRQIVIGQFLNGDFIGVHFSQLINSSIHLNSIDCCFSADDYKQKKDISSVWFENYFKIGRCLYIPHTLSWIEGIDNRFSKDSHLEDERTCSWCGKIEHKKSKIITRIETYWK